jgi:hypothetical protein
MSPLRKNAPVVFMGLILALAFGLVASTACKKQPPVEAEKTEPAPPVETWVKHALEGEGFEILTPVAFTRTDDKAATDAGEIAFVNLMAQASEKLLYTLVYSDMPEALVTGQDAMKLLQGARDGIVRQFRGYLEKEAPITLGEHQGLETRMTGTSQGVNFDIRSRFYLVKNRLFGLHIIVQRGFEGIADADKYFGSFKLK